MTAEAWTARREVSNRTALRLIIWIGRSLGRTVTRGFLHFAVAYYVVMVPGARTASRRYLARMFGRPAAWWQVYRHFFYFATIIADRIFVMGGQTHKLQVTAHNRELLLRTYAQKKGALIIVAHLGSFEIMRVLGAERGGLRLRILMDRAAGEMTNAAMDAINPELRSSFIDTSESDVDRVLKVKAALDQGEMVCLMADRCQPGERSTDCDFLGGSAPFPLSPWLLAGVLQVPVILAFGLYRGGKVYDLYFEEFAPPARVARAQRMQTAHRRAQGYADRLAHHARQAPYNWFNFYDFWHT